VYWSVYEWDETKRLINIEKHAIDFLDLYAVWKGPVLETRSPQTNHREDRWIAIGLLDGQHTTIVYTWRNCNKRLISARRARKNERENYNNATR